MSDRSYVTIKVGPLTADQAAEWTGVRDSPGRGLVYPHPSPPRTLTEAFQVLDQRCDEDPMDAVEGSVLEFIDNECASGAGNDELVAATLTLEEEGVAFEIEDEGCQGCWGPSVVWWRPGMAQPLQYLRHTDEPVVLFHTAAVVLARRYPEAWAALVEAAQWDPAWPIPTRSGVPADVIATAASR